MTARNMNRRHFLKLTAAGTSAALLECLPERRDNALKKPNVLFVFVDQLRIDILGIYGGRDITTPHLDRLASEGIHFTNAISSCPLCTPYRGMLHTGRYPTHSGIVTNSVQASPVQNPHCLAKVFAEAGYDTGYLGKWHLSAGITKKEGKGRHPNREAVQAYLKINPEPEYVPPGPERLGYEHWEAYNFHSAYNNYWYYRDEPQKLYSGKYETDTLIDQAITYMENHKEDGKPFFLNVSPHPPHPPLNPAFTPEGYLEKITDQLKWAPNVPSNNPRSLLERRCYLAMSKNVDDNIGRLMQYLDESGLAEDTIVVFTSDHGEMHGSHGRIAKVVPYAEAVNIPLIIRWPRRIKPGIRSDALFVPIDHLPTLCNLVGISSPNKVDGIDMSKVILGHEQDSREEVFMGNYSSHGHLFQTATIWPEWRGVRTKRYTYCKLLSGEERLWDNIEDPYQMKNLTLGRSELPILRRLQKRLKEFLAEAHDEFLPGSAFGEWYDDERNLVRTGLGPVRG